MSDWIVHEGDCLDVMRGLPDASVDAVICDPPYGTTACKWDSVIPFAPMWSALKRIAKPRAAIVLFGSQPFTSALVMSNPGMFRYEWVWDKARGTGFLIAKKRPMMRHENVCVFSKEPLNYYPQMKPRQDVKRSRNYSVSEATTGFRLLTEPREYTERYPTSIIAVSNAAQGEKQHPTQKPVALMEYLVRTYTNEGDTVLDFTAGSGTTGVACVQTGRSFIGIESHPPYVEIARQRITAAAQQLPLISVA